MEKNRGLGITIAKTDKMRGKIVKVLWIQVKACIQRVFLGFLTCVVIGWML